MLEIKSYFCLSFGLFWTIFYNCFVKFFIKITRLPEAQNIWIYSNINNEKLNNDIFETKAKQKFPDQKIFRINSLIFNEEKEKKEIYTKYDCIYNKKDNSLYILFNKNMNYINFTKDKLINILDFSNSVKIETIYILINKTNKYFVNIIWIFHFIF